MIPIMFFVLGAALASMGPGNIATAALLAPMAMATAARVGIPLFLMAIMVGNGANAGVAVAVRADRHHRQRPDGAHRAAGLRDARPISTTSLAHALVAFGGYFLFGGLKLFAGSRGDGLRARRRPTRGRHAFDAQHWMTLGGHRRRCS